VQWHHVQAELHIKAMLLAASARRVDNRQRQHSRCQWNSPLISFPDMLHEFRYSVHSSSVFAMDEMDQVRF
jgi:hypothetical protein